MTIEIHEVTEAVLPRVSRPNRYIAPFSPARDAEVRICLVHPGEYETVYTDSRCTGFLARLLEAGPGVACDVAFSVGDDLADLLREEGRPLFGTALHRPLSDYDLLLLWTRSAFDRETLDGLLELGGVDSGGDAPLLGLVGPVAPDLAADDRAAFALVGDPEAFVDDLRTLAREAADDRAGALARFADAPGVRLPGTKTAARRFEGVPPLPAAPLVPVSEVGADALRLEISRAAGPGEPIRRRTVEEIVADAERGLLVTGQAEILLEGDEAAAHPDLVRLLETLNPRLAVHGISCRVPRVDAAHFTPALAREILKAKRARLRFEPVAASARLREAEGRPLSRDGLVEALTTAVRGGWSRLEVPIRVGAEGETAADRRELAGVLDTLETIKRKGQSPPAIAVRLLPAGTDPATAAAAESLAAELGSRGKGSRIKVTAVDPATAAAELPPLVPVEEGSPTRLPTPPAAVESGTLGSPSWATPGRRARRGTPRGKDARRADRYRIRFAKEAPLRFTSHLETGRCLERAFRRAQVPVAQTQGKDRRPRIAFGPPLPLGMTSDAEYVDVVFEREIPETFLGAVNRVMPEGLRLVAAAPVRNQAASLASAIQEAEYVVEFPDALLRSAFAGFDAARLESFLRERLDAVLAQETFTVTRVRKERARTFNARPSLIRGEVVRDDGGRPAVQCRLTLNRSDSVRPETFLAALVDRSDLDERLFRIRRTGLYVPGGAEALDPLDVVRRDFAWWKQPSGGAAL